MSVSLEQQLLVYTTAVMLVSVNPADACYDESKIELKASDIASMIRNRTKHLCRRERAPPHDVHVRTSDVEKIFDYYKTVFHPTEKFRTNKLYDLETCLMKIRLYKYLLSIPKKPQI